ncbi:hypothetical protein DFH11DRAFT_1583251 [Phellopilus nigrolimitatus]|nr:hypothetical protein DFH11DRAFT_1583251 [Phellopilus nigrolimitatus]
MAQRRMAHGEDLGVCYGLGEAGRGEDEELEEGQRRAPLVRPGRGAGAGASEEVIAAGFVRASALICGLRMGRGLPQVGVVVEVEIGELHFVGGEQGQRGLGVARGGGHRRRGRGFLGLWDVKAASESGSPAGQPRRPMSSVTKRPCGASPETCKLYRRDDDDEDAGAAAVSAIAMRSAVAGAVQPQIIPDSERRQGTRLPNGAAFSTTQSPRQNAKTRRVCSAKPVGYVNQRKNHSPRVTCYAMHIVFHNSVIMYLLAQLTSSTIIEDVTLEEHLPGVQTWPNECFLVIAG